MSAPLRRDGRFRSTGASSLLRMNPLISDTFIDFLLTRVLDVESLSRVPGLEACSADTCGPWLDACRRLARSVLFPDYRAIDATPPAFSNGRVTLHPRMHEAWRGLRELDVIAALGTLPQTVSTLSSLYLMAGNLSAYGVAGLTAGAAHLLEAFGSDALRATFAPKLRSGEWTGTMALTEPQAGSSLADVTSRATPRGDHFLLRGSKIFISGGDHDLAQNVVHLVLARIDGAPAGTRGISLFAVPRLRPDTLEDNDVRVAGVIHKIGWRGLPSLALNFGEDGHCHGWLVGAPNQGLKCMFQMMNEARLMVGANAVATASVAFHESLAYARERRQGRPLGVTDVTLAPVPLIEHPDVRRMLLRQKAIVEGATALLGVTARYADLSTHAVHEEDRARARWLLDLLTPIAKTFPAERGFESNALALQIHGGYGYSSEYLPEAWLRDQKLNSIHEGTTTIQGLDLLGRKVIAGGGAALQALMDEMTAEVQRSSRSLEAFTAAMARTVEVTAQLGAKGADGDVVGMLAHSADYLDALSTLVIGWMWVRLENALGPRDDAFATGLRAAASYWLATEVPRVGPLLALCAEGERSYVDLPSAAFDGA